MIIQCKAREDIPELVMKKGDIRGFSESGYEDYKDRLTKVKPDKKKPADKAGEKITYAK